MIDRLVIKSQVQNAKVEYPTCKYSVPSPQACNQGG